MQATSKSDHETSGGTPPSTTVVLPTSDDIIDTTLVTERDLLAIDPGDPLASVLELAVHSNPTVDVERDSEIKQSLIMSTTHETVSGHSAIDKDSTSSNIATNADANGIDASNDEIARLLQTQMISQSSVSNLQASLRENIALKDKVSKLKVLPSKSSKASKELKADMESYKQALERSHVEIGRLNHRVEMLVSRPTHMDILLDFETKFDKAVLSVNKGLVQSGGEDPSSSPNDSKEMWYRQRSGVEWNDGRPNEATIEEENFDETLPPSHSKVLNELVDAKGSVKQLESTNVSLLHQVSKLEQENKSLIMDRDAGKGIEILP